MRNTLVIVGAGFSGTVLATNLLRRPPSAATDIVLIERGPAIGRGIAYAASDFPYLLNVPAGRLSADSRDSLQFLSFARRRLPTTDAEDFLPRSLYGDYLEHMLLEAEGSAPQRVALKRVFAEVTGVQRADGNKPFALQLTERAPLLADWVVLALGTPPAPVPPWAAELQDHGAFRHNPRDLPMDLGAQQSVLIIGNGLTMVDAACALSRDAKRAPMLHTISRRGLLPHPQTAFRAAVLPDHGEGLLSCAHSLRKLLSASREMAQEIEKAGGDWREAVTFIRGLMPSLWRQLPEIERRRFIRHLQTHWDVHRHRLPPQLSARIEDLRRSGRLQVNAGRVQTVADRERRLQVSWRPRGSHGAQTLTVDLLVDATGPHYDIAGSTDGLISSLCAANLVSADALNLGIRTAQNGACIDREGRVSNNLFYLGPMLRADHWEATAANELRDHAERLAAHLVAPRV